MKIDSGPCVADAGVDFIRSIETNVFFWKISVARPRHAGASLAVAAMADVDQSRLARDDDAKLTAKALRGSFHNSPPKFLIHAMRFIRSPRRLERGSMRISDAERLGGPFCCPSQTIARRQAASVRGISGRPMSDRPKRRFSGLRDIVWLDSQRRIMLVFI